MAIAVFNLLTDFFFSIFGSGLIMATILIFVVVLAMLALKADAVVILMVLIPLLVAFVLNISYSNFLAVPTWILLILFMIAGFIFSMFILQFFR